MSTTRKPRRRVFLEAVLATAFMSAGLSLSLAGCGGGGGGDSHECVHGVRSASTGGCACDLGYVGEKCDACADTWQDRDGDGTCLPDCGPHGKNAESWSVFDMRTACTCDEGYAGERCGACAAGFQDNDGDGACLPDCDRAGLSCPGGKVCDDASGTASCVDAPSDWTFMVYLDGDNNLGFDDFQATDFASDDLDEMVDGLAMADEEAASRINVIVLFDQSALSDDPTTRVYRVTAQGYEKLDSGSDIFVGKEANMADAKTLKKFGVWAVKNFPAARYALLLWDHGGGWRGAEGDGPGSFKTHCGSTIRSLVAGQSAGAGESSTAPAFRDFSWDETNGNNGSITVSDGTYRETLEAIAAKAGRKLDVVAFDACLMGMYEVALETASAAHYLVASEESVPGTGFPYDDVLELLAMDTKMDGKAFARSMVEAYGNGGTFQYGSMTYSSNATMGAYDLALLPQLTEALDAFGNALTRTVSDGEQRKALADVARASQRFGFQEHVDIRHLAMLVADESEYGDLSEDLKAPADALADALDQVVIHSRKNTLAEIWDGRSHDDAYGMALFFPEAADCDYYNSGMGDDYVLTLFPCIHAPEKPSNGTGNYTRAGVKNYLKVGGWSQGWTGFLKAYLDM